MSYLWAWWRPKDKRSAQPAYNKCDIGRIAIGHALLIDYERFVEPLDVSVVLESSEFKLNINSGGRGCEDEEPRTGNGLAPASFVMYTRPAAATRSLL